MNLTRGKIRRRIGLDLKAKYDCHHGRNLWPEYGDRRSGRTTDLIVSVLDRLQYQRDCTIVAHNAKYANQLVSQIREYAYRLSLDPSRVEPLSAARQERLRPLGSASIFHDHYRGQ